jgi:hypothetical protein
MLHKGAARSAATPRHGAAGWLRRLKPLEAVGQKATQPTSGAGERAELEQDSRTLQGHDRRARYTARRR